MPKQICLIDADTPRELRFDVNAFCLMEDLMGKTVNQMDDNPGMKDLRIIFYCGLRWMNKTMKLDEVGEIMDAALAKNTLEELGETLTKAMSQALGQDTSEHPAKKQRGGKKG